MITPAAGVLLPQICATYLLELAMPTGNLYYHLTPGRLLLHPSLISAAGLVVPVTRGHASLLGKETNVEKAERRMNCIGWVDPAYGLKLCCVSVL